MKQITPNTTIIIWKVRIFGKVASTKNTDGRNVKVAPKVILIRVDKSRKN